MSIVNYENVSPAVSSEFNSGCVPNCGVTLCSCTEASSYWSSTSYASDSARAWFVDFFVGGVSSSAKSDFNFVRAVRGGL